MAITTMGWGRMPSKVRRFGLRAQDENHQPSRGSGQIWNSRSPESASERPVCLPLFSCMSAVVEFLWPQRSATTLIVYYIEYCRPELTLLEC